MKLSLNCLVLGYPKGFTVNVPEEYTNEELTVIKYNDLTVSNFIEIIKNKVKHAVSEPEDPNSMNLWVVDVAQEKLKNISEKDIENKFEGKLMDHINPLSDYFPDGSIPTVRNIHIIIVPVSSNQNKRIKLEGLKPEDVETKTIKFLQDLLLPFDEPISRDNIRRWFNEQLRRRLPAHSYHCQNYPTILDYEETDHLPALCAVTSFAMGSFNERANQEMFTSDNVNNIIFRMIDVVGTYISNCRLEWVRNNKIDELITTTSKRGVRPDVIVYFKNVVVMMGEEKDVQNKLQIAAGELDEYFSFWNTLAFGDLPLVFGFAACGTQIQFYYYHAIDSSIKPTRETIGDLLSLGTDSKLNNLQALRYVINIIRILRTFDQQGVIRTPYLKLFNVIPREHCKVMIGPEKVIKTIKRNAIEDEVFHKELYHTILPKLGYYKNIEYKTTKNTIHVIYGPVGFSSIPKDEDDLRRAILNILEVVDKLHDEQVVHRDIRWDNVVKLTENKWMLIDFEEAAQIGDERTLLRIVAPEYKNGEVKCQASGDIWMIGKLIDDSRIRFSLSKRAQNFRDRLMNNIPDRRPTAADAIEDDWFNGMELDG